MSKLLIVSVFSLFPLFAQAQAGNKSVINPEELANRVNSGKPSIGIMLGLANAEGSYKNGLNYGVEAGFQFAEPLSAQLELSGYTAGRENSEPGLTRTKILAKAMYNFAGNTPVIKYSYAGAGIGPVFDNTGNDQKVNIGLAPQVGFDIPLRQSDSKFSLGANVAMLIVTGGSPNSLSANGVAKYWF